MRIRIVPSQSLILSLCVAILVFASRPGAGDSSPHALPDAPPALINMCLITNDVPGLAAFYEQVLQVQPHKEGDDYVEFRTGTAVLALFSASAQERYMPGSTTPGQNHSAILEFRVRDVDQEYARLQNVVRSWVKKPATQPWGTRSIYFRDPDGNLVDFFTVASPK